MKRLQASVFLFIITLASAVGLWAEGARLTGSDLVKLTAHTDRAATAPGDTFRVGIEFKIEPQWHIYFANSGDAGLPTEVSWQLPEGVTAGELQWEFPRYYLEGGMIVTYGYSDSVVLWADVAVSEGFAGSSLEIAASAAWLVCKETCLPGSGEVALTLPIAAAPAPAESPRLAEAVSLTPREPLDASAVTVSRVEPGDVGGTHGAIMVEFAADAIASADNVSRRRATSYDRTYFYARPLADAITGRAQVLEGGRALIIPFLDPLPESGTFAGILTVRQTDDLGDVVAAVEVTADLATLPVAGVGASEAQGLSTQAGGARARFSLDGADFSSAGLEGVAGSSILYVLFIAFIGGLILNVMPCVLPVISLKVFSLVRQAGESRGRVFMLGAIFTLGVWVSFMVLAGAILVLKGLGHQVGWAFQFQSPAFNYIMLIILTAFAMSLFGLFEVNLPGSVQQGAAQASHREGPLGAFFGGALSTVLATPCMAPLLAPALGYALTLPPVEMLAIFSMMALGLAAPFLLLSMNPRWSRFLPKPGDWMVTFKQLMGFAMLGAALFPLYVLTDMGGSGMMVAMGMFMLLIGLGGFIYGRFADLAAPPRQRFITTASVLGGLLVAHLVFIQPMLSAAAEGPKNLTSQQAVASAGGIAWVPFSMEELERRLNAGENVFIDFTASWCITCIINESVVIDTPVIRAVFESGQITPMKADWTRRDDEITRMLQRFGRAGVPFYVIFPASNPEAPIVLPELLTHDILLNAFAEASNA